MPGGVIDATAVPGRLVGSVNPALDPLLLAMEVAVGGDVDDALGGDVYFALAMESEPGVVELAIPAVVAGKPKLDFAYGLFPGLP